MAVHIGSRAAAAASAHEVLVSRTVRDLSPDRGLSSKTVENAYSRVAGGDLAAVRREQLTSIPGQRWTRPGQPSGSRGCC